MTAPKRERFANNASTTLNGGINDTTTSVLVTSAAAFPTDGNFRIIIDSEILLVTAVSSNTFTVVRGYESTTAATHSNGASVALVLTADSVDRYGKDNVPIWGYNLPLAKIVDDDGSTLLTASDFSWVNQGTATVTDQAGTILMRLPNVTGVNLRGQARSAPSTPYSYVGAFHTCMPRGDTGDVCMLMMGFRNSTEFEMQTFIVGTNGDEPYRVGVQNYSTGTTSAGIVRSLTATTIFSNAIWLKVEDDGTNLKYHVGMDGKNWIEIYSAGRTSWIPTGPNQIFWGGVNNQNTHNDSLIRLLHWSRES